MLLFPARSDSQLIAIAIIAREKLGIIVSKDGKICHSNRGPITLTLMIIIIGMSNVSRLIAHV